MKHWTIVFITLLATLFLPQIEALNRDYQPDHSKIFHSWCEEDESFYEENDYYFCAEHCWFQLLKKPLGIGIFYFYGIPAIGPNCTCCGHPSIYLGYVDQEFKKYTIHLKQHLEYSSKHKECVCYWPECSQEAAQISDTAYLLFQDLISTTALSNLLQNESQQKEFIENTALFLDQHELTISFIAQQFRFSDYYHVCRDIENYAIANYEEREAAKIKDRLVDVLEALYPNFFTLYTSCYTKHPSADIDQEIRFMKLLVNDISGLEKTVVTSEITHPFSTVENSYDVLLKSECKGILKKKQFKKSPHKTLSSNVDSSLSKVNSNKARAVVFSPQSDILLEQGTLFNNLLLYNEAIHVLTRVIQFNSSNRDAYLERALAYFETNQLSLALQDYEVAKKLTVVPSLKGSHKGVMVAAIYIPENKTDFSQGLVLGTVEGANVSAVEFVPSIFSCCRGVLNGLWAFACSPVEVSREMINASYAIGEFISNQGTEEFFQCVVPELKELSLAWSKLNDHSRGQKIGYIIGKYGIDIFAPIGALKGINKIRALKRANTMYTLENCVSSQVKQSKIMEQSIKRAAIREKVVSESIKNGKILVRNSNTQIHIMQPKHLWNNVIKISGNAEEDCKNVVRLLEDNKIFLEKYRVSTRNHYKFTQYDHQMQINGYEVKAVFSKNLETSEIFLNDAWVMTK